MIFYRIGAAHKKCWSFGLVEEMGMSPTEIEGDGAVLTLKEYEKGKSILYQMITYHPYQNTINKRYVCKNNYSLIYIFHLLIE